MSSAGGGSSVTISFNGQDAGLSSTIDTTQSALKLLGDAFDMVGGSSEGLSALMAAFADNLDLASASMASAATATTDLATGMTEATSTTEELTSATDLASASADKMGASMMAASEQIGAGAGGGGLTGAISGAIEPMTNFIQRSADIVAGLMAWSAIQQVISWVQQLADELFNLNVTTEKTVNGWAYLLGTNGGPSKANAASMASWTSQFSMGIPFTRQDLMTGVTTLAASDMNTKQIQEFMPYLSDIAATYGSAAYGGHGVNLAQAASAVRAAGWGMTRMLKTDLNISPQQLVPYGLQGTGTGMGFHITDINSLYRSLENFAIAKGVSTPNGDQGGASKEMATTTWWGSLSSAQDRLQNFLLSAGGTNLDGSIRQGSFFATIKTDLNDLMTWFDDHSGQINKFADVLSALIGTVVKSGGGLMGAFFDWMGKIMPYQDVLANMANAGQKIQDIFLGTSGNTNTFTPGKPQKGAHTGGSSGGVGGAGGRAVLSNANPVAPQGASGIDWNDLPVLGGIIQGFNQVADIVNWKPLADAFQQLGQGWHTFTSGFDPTIGAYVLQTLRGLGDILTASLQWPLMPLTSAIKSFATGFDSLGQILHKVQPYFDPIVKSMDAFNTALTGLLTALNHGDWSKALDILERIFGMTPGANSGQHNGTMGNGAYQRFAPGQFGANGR